MDIHPYRIDSYGNKYIIEFYHFYIQMVRIPYNDEPTLCKIMQIAFNIGQIQGTLEIDEVLNNFDKLER